jgi:glucose-6-phosphate isomerase
LQRKEKQASLSLSILNDSTRESSQRFFHEFEAGHYLERLRAGDPSDSELASLAMETDAKGNVTKNSLGVYNLAWQAVEHPEWAAQVQAEAERIKHRIQETHGLLLRFIIWAGMGGSIEDKNLYNAAGLFKRGPRFYALDSTDPLKLKAIIENIQHISGLQLPDILRSTLVVGQALGMTSYEPVVNLTKLAGLYDKFGIDSRPNFVYMTLPGSILDQFASSRGFERIPLQLDDGNSTSGRHSSPLTRGSLLPLALAGVDLTKWFAGTHLTDDEISTAWKLAAFIHAQGLERRDKVSLVLPRSWSAAGIWTKQDFEESLGKSEELGLKIVIDEKPRLRNFSDDRAFLVVQLKGEAHPHALVITAIRHAKLPVAVLTFPGRTVLSKYMQFMHYVVGGLGYLRKMNFVTQPGVELYKSIASEIFGAKNQAELFSALTCPNPKAFAARLKQLASSHAIEYGEITYFGDTRYSEEGIATRRLLNRAADLTFRSRLKMPADVYEGPAMNHSYHEMIIGHGKCFTIVLAPRKQTRFAVANYDPDYHMAQFLATRQALERRNRHVLAFLVDDLADLAEWFQSVASNL